MYNSRDFAHLIDDQVFNSACIGICLASVQSGIVIHAPVSIKHMAFFNAMLGCYVLLYVFILFN
jgi:hypothetical protein